MSKYSKNLVSISDSMLNLTPQGLIYLHLRRLVNVEMSTSWSHLNVLGVIVSLACLTFVTVLRNCYYFTHI